jgi:hypothetical protein
LHLLAATSMKIMKDFVLIETEMVGRFKANRIW